MLGIAILRGRGRGPLHLVIVEPRAEVGRGVAYSTPDPLHLLNVPAESMSAIESEPAHFLRWAQRRDAAIHPCDFLPRRDFGEYLAATLAKEIEAAAGTATVEVVRDRVERLEPGRPARAMLADGTTIAAGHVVLAIGSGPTRDAARISTALRASRHYVADPWSADPRRHAGRDERVLLIGTGLTMVDVALSLHADGAGPRMLAVSRSGLHPRGHRPGQPRRLLTFPLADGSGGMGALMRAFFGELGTAASLGGDITDVVDSIRPVTQQIWCTLDPEERRWFLANVRRHWEVNRHRMAPAVAARIEALRDSGALRIERAGVAELRRGGAGVLAVLERDGRTEEVEFDRVINCAGPEDDVRRIETTPLAPLLAAGTVRPDPLGLGLEVGLDGRLIDAEGAAAPNLHAVGPLRKGSLWESTAIPEIRRQADELAARLLAVAGVAKSS
jgi:uncharacterized NAD(P)/FAD-binding protein YdhS